MAFATRKVVKGPGGKPHVMFVDTATREPIPHSEIGNYSLIEHGDNLEIPEHQKKEGSGGLSGGLGGLLGQLGLNLPEQDYQGNAYEETDPNPDLGTREHSNNFGFIDRPALVSLLANAPGMLGTFGKGINLALNVNNLSAINAARTALGLPTMTGMEAFNNIRSDTKGYVGDIVAGDTQYAVGLKGQTKTGRTTLTPSEAQSRLTKALLSGQESRLATPQEAKAAVKAHQAEFGTRVDLTSGKGIAKAVVDKLLETVSPSETANGRSPEDTTPVAPDDHPENVGLNQIAPDPNEITGSVNQDLAQTSQEGLAPYVENYGSKRPEAPTNPNLINLVQRAVTDLLGPDHTIIGLSGKGEHGSSRHRGGDAVDFQVQDPSGKIISDPNVIDQIGEALGRVGITGAGAGYKGMGRSIHADLSKGLEGTWGRPSFSNAFKSGQQQSGIQGHSEVGRLPDSVPTPGPPGTGLAGTPGAPGSSGEPAPGSLADAFIEGEVTGETNTGTPGQLSFVPAPAPPAPESNKEGTQPVPAPTPTPNPGQQASGQVGQGFAGGQGQGGDGNLGGGSRGIPEEVIPLLTLMIAGELGQNTINGIRTGNPAAISTARQEIADIAATVNNRANSSKLQGSPNPYGVVLNPGHYNSLKPENLNTTRLNASVAGSFVEKAIRDFNNGQLTGKAPNSTHYFNPNIVDPGWSKNITGPAIDSGEHRFVVANQKGTTTPEFTPALPTTNAPTPTGRPTVAEQVVQDLVAAPVDRDIERSDLAAPNMGLTPAELAALAQANVTVHEMTQDEIDSLIAAGLGRTSPTAPSFTGNLVGYSNLSPNEGIGTLGVNTSSVGANAGLATNGGAFGNAAGSGWGSQGSAGLQGMTNLSTSGIISGIAGTGIGFNQGFNAGQLGTSGFLSPSVTGIEGAGGRFNSSFSGLLDNVSISPSVAVDQNGVAIGPSIGGSKGFAGNAVSSGFGSPGTLGMSSGGGGGHQADAGIGMGVGPGAVGTMSSTAGMNSAANSFGGFNAGSLAGTASGIGSGLGSIGNDAAVGGGFTPSGPLGQTTTVSTSPTSSVGLGSVGPSVSSGLSGIGSGVSAGSLSGTASGIGSGLGTAGTSGGGSFVNSFSPDNSVIDTSGFGAPLSNTGGVTVLDTIDVTAYGGDVGYGGGGGSTGSSGSTGYGGYGGFSGPGSGPDAGTGSEVGIDGSGGYGGGDGGGGGGGKVICGYFYSKGRIPKRIYLGDLKYSKEFAHPRTSAGYLLWARPVVRWLEKKPNRPIVDSLLFPFTKGWVYEMAYRVGYSNKRPLWGRIVTPSVSAVCYLIGYIKEKLSS